MEIIFLITIGICAISSYIVGFKYGYNEGSNDSAVETISQLWSDGIINIRKGIDEDGNPTIRILNPNAPEEQENV